MQTRQWRIMLSALIVAVLIPIVSTAQIERGATRLFTLENEGKPIELGHYHALVIGNNDYQHLSPLKTAVADARAVASVLKSKYGFNVQLLVNATRYDILATLNGFRERLGENDNFLLYYGGHGEMDPSSNRCYWLPVDAEPGETKNWISNPSVTDILNAMGAKHAMIIADSCFSGSLARSAPSSHSSDISPKLQAKWLRQMIAQRSRTVLTSGELQPVLDGGGGNHSVFAEVLLDVLRENAGILHGDGLFHHVKNAAVQKSASAPHYGYIKFAGDLGGKFLFVPMSIFGVPDNSGPSSQGNLEILFWQSVVNCDEVGCYQAYLDRYPDGIFSSLARIRLHQEEPRQAPTVTVSPPTEAARQAELERQRQQEAARQADLERLRLEKHQQLSEAHEKRKRHQTAQLLSKARQAQKADDLQLSQELIAQGLALMPESRELLVLLEEVQQQLASHQAQQMEAAPQHQTEYIERYPTIEAQDQVNVAQDFNVLVSLTEKSMAPDVLIVQVGPDAQRAAEGALGVTLSTAPDQAYWEIDVLLSAPSFLLGGSDSQTIRLPRYGGDSTPARFKLKAKSIAAEREEKTLYATFWHKGAYLAKVAKTIIVFDLARPNTPATEAGEAAIGAAFGSSAREVRQRLSPPAQASLQKTVADVGKSPMSFWGQLEPPDLTVWLMRLPDSDDQQLMMLSSPHLQPSTHIIHGPERARLEQWLQSYYGRFAAASRGAQRDGIQPQALSKEQNIAMLQGFGRELYRRFAPDPFKQAFWSLQDQLSADFSSIQIFTDDPLLPWELLVPSLPGAGDDSLSRADKYGFLGMDYRLARWHLSQSQSLLQRPPPSIALDTLVVIAPDYLEQPLPHVGDEVRLLRQFSRFQSLPGQFGPIDRFFRTQSLPSGVIHFAGHGIVQTNESGLSEYSIQLEDAELDLMSWRGMVSNQSGGHPLFFFNACDLGQAAHVLNFVDGWAPAVLEAGAGGYIGGLWPLSDKGASEFAQEFYDLIKTDRDATVTIADLLRQTRTHFFESGDPTYLAYVYYGDPNFTLQRLPETGF